MIDTVIVPELEHDARMIREFGDRYRLRPEQRLERRIVATLCAYLADKGFPVQYVDDGEEATATPTAKDAMELVFNLDDARVCFAAPNGRTHRVYLVMGNGEDIISDYDFSKGDGDGFQATMDAFMADMLPTIEVR